MKNICENEIGLFSGQNTRAHRKSLFIVFAKMPIPMHDVRGQIGKEKK